MTKIILSEGNVAILLGISLEQLEVLRQRRGLPFLRVDAVHRVYFKSDIIEWLEERRIILGK